jgi:hypothetical protein
MCHSSRSGVVEWLEVVYSGLPHSASAIMKTHQSTLSPVGSPIPYVQVSPSIRAINQHIATRTWENFLWFLCSVQGVAHDSMIRAAQMEDLVPGSWLLEWGVWV